jgi:hypothetical protein
MLKLIETVWRTKFTFYFKAIKKLNFGRKYTGNRPIAPQLLSWGQNNSQIRDLHQILDRFNVFKTKSMTWPQKIFLDYSSAFFAIFDDFRVFWMETWTIPHFVRGSRKSGYFLCQLNGYLAMSTFRNRKYRTALVFSDLKNELCSLANKHQ